MLSGALKVKPLGGLRVLDRALKQQKKNGFCNTTTVPSKIIKKSKVDWVQQSVPPVSLRTFEKPNSVFHCTDKKITRRKIWIQALHFFLLLAFSHIAPIVSLHQDVMKRQLHKRRHFFKGLVHLGSELVGAVRTGPILEVNAFESGEGFFLSLLCSQRNTEKVLVFGHFFFPVLFCFLCFSHYVT